MTNDKYLWDALWQFGLLLFSVYSIRQHFARQLLFDLRLWNIFFCFGAKKVECTRRRDGLTQRQECQAIVVILKKKKGLRLLFVRLNIRVCQREWIVNLQELCVFCQFFEATSGELASDASGAFCPYWRSSNRYGNAIWLLTGFHRTEICFIECIIWHGGITIKRMGFQLRIEQKNTQQ